MLHLYIWGPAFGLPSIDAECLAAVAYLHDACSEASWRLLPCYDPSISPSNLLPALNHDGVWTSGYSRIVRYLVANSLCSDLDASLSASQRADILACSSFLASQAAPLLDLSLYASSANWAAATRPAYSTLLPFPLTWTIPPLIRAAALRRVENLGLTQLDGDFDPSGTLSLGSGAEALPESFRRHLPGRTRRTVQEEMTPEQAAAIRLYAMAEDCFVVMDGWANAGPGTTGDDRTGLVPGSSNSSLDCLACAYLALMLVPSVPRTFLRDCMEESTPWLVHYAGGWIRTLLSATLPWATPDSSGLTQSIGRVVDTTVRHIPVVGDRYADEKRRRVEGGVRGLDQQGMLFATGILLTGLAAGYGVYTYRAMQPFGVPLQIWKQTRIRSTFSSFGEAGEIFNSAFGGMSMGAGPASTGAARPTADNTVD